MNIAHLIGNVGKAPGSRTTQAGKQVVSFSLATTERWRSRDTGERQEQTTWHNCVCFQEGLCGVISQYVGKGSKIQVSGKISNRSYDKDGVTKYVSEIVVSNVELLDGPQDRQQSAQTQDPQAPLPSQQTSLQNDLSDEIPF